jgi:hypothetical protein
MLKLLNLVYFSAFFRASRYSGSLNHYYVVQHSHTMIATRDFGGSPEAVAVPAARYFPP